PQDALRGTAGGDGHDAKACRVRGGARDRSAFLRLLERFAGDQAALGQVAPPRGLALGLGETRLRLPQGLLRLRADRTNEIVECRLRLPRTVGGMVCAEL